MSGPKRERKHSVSSPKPGAQALEKFEVARDLRRNPWLFGAEVGESGGLRGNNVALSPWATAIRG